MSNEILQGNEKIAQFMGAVWGKDDFGADGYSYNENKPPTGIGSGYEIGALKYHSSWDWLMPVVEKIETMIINVPKKYQRGFMKNTSEAVISIDVGYDERTEFLGWHWSLHFTGGNYIAEANERAKTKIIGTYLAVLAFIDWYTLNVTPS